MIITTQNTDDSLKLRAASKFFACGQPAIGRGDEQAKHSAAIDPTG
jgi:hypothetical protein